MAILGYQLVSTLIGISLLTKLSAHFSFTSALVFRGIFRSLLPTDKEILESAGLTKVKSRGKRTNGSANGDNPETFHFPRSTPLKLRKTEVRAHEIAALPYYTELVWLVDFTICALFVLFANDFISFIRPIVVFSAPPSAHSSADSFFAPSTINLNLVWAFFVVWFSMSSLFSIVLVYTGRGGSGGGGKSNNKEATGQSYTGSNSDWPLLIVSAFSSFVVAMLCLSLDVTFFDLRIGPAYGNLTLTLQPNTTSVSAMSWGMFHTCLATYAAVVGLLFIFPSLQYGRVYVQTLRNPESSWLTNLLFHINFFAPQLTLFLWVVPLVLLLPMALLQHASGKMSTPWFSFVVLVARALSWEHISSLRLFFTLLTVGIRLAMTKRHMQAFLDTAQSRLDRLSREPGKITNREVQRIVASIFHCFNFAAIQYLAPTFLLIGLAFCYKLSTGAGWLPLGLPQTQTIDSSSQTSLSMALDAFAGQEWESIFTAPWFAALKHTREAFGGVWDSVRVQAGHVGEGVLGFALFWCLLAWQTVTMTGMAFHRFVE